MRLFGDVPWTVRTDEGWAELGDTRFELDVVGTESRRAGTFVWAWANPSIPAEHAITATMVARVGAESEIPELVDDAEIPLDRIDGHRAGIIASEIGSAAGYYVGNHDEGALVFLLRGQVLHQAPFEVEDVLPVVDGLVAGGFGVDPRRALEAFAAEPLDGFEATFDERGGAITGAGGRWTFTFDRRGRVAGFEMTAPVDRPAPPSDDEPPEVLTRIGVLDLPAGPVAVFDPLLAVEPALAEPWPGALPSGTYDVAVELDADGRVELAHLLLAEGEPEWWRPVGAVWAGSGVCCFATPAAAERLVAGGEEAIARLDETEGLVHFTTHAGAGEHELLRGYDADDRLVRITVAMVTEPPGDGADLVSAGLERAALWPYVDLLDPRNQLLLPRAAHRRLTRVHREALRLSAEVEIDFELLPEYEGTSAVPVRLRVRVEAGARSFEETIEV